MTWSKAIYPPLHDLLFVHQLSGEQIKRLVAELELKKVVGQDPQASLTALFVGLGTPFSDNLGTPLAIST